MTFSSRYYERNTFYLLPNGVVVTEHLPDWWDIYPIIALTVGPDSSIDWNVVYDRRYTKINVLCENASGCVDNPIIWEAGRRC